MSIYEEDLRLGKNRGDAQIEIVDEHHRPTRPGSKPPVITKLVRPAPDTRPPDTAGLTIVPQELTVDPTEVDSYGHGTSNAGPALPPGVIRVVANAPPAPESQRKATVIFTSLGPASKSEQQWVIGGDTGMRLVTTDKFTGIPRLVAIYIGFKVRSYSTEPGRPGEITVFGDVRWHGMPTDREAAWTHKLVKRNGGERQKQLAAALERLFAFADPRVGMVARFLGGPATTGEVAAAHGYQYFPGGGRPSVKFMVDMRHTQEGAQHALDFYREAQDLFALPLRRWWWRWFNRDLEALFALGKRFDVVGLPRAQTEDGLTGFERARLYTDVAVEAREVVGSGGSIAWAGDEQIENALRGRNMPTVVATTYTVCNEGERARKDDREDE